MPYVLFKAVSASYSRRAINFSSTSSNETSNVASVKFPEAREDSEMECGKEKGGR